MNFDVDPALEAFRSTVRSFLKAHLPAASLNEPPKVRVAAEELRRWQATLNQQGWGAPGWAREDGGTGWSVSEFLIFEEECVAAAAPAQDVFGLRLLGPVLNRFGTAEQQREHRPHILTGGRLWCQGFSEPGSGSDLASLRTRAEMEPDGTLYRINGQKIWTSYAHQADWIFVLARTDPDARKQAGLSFFMIDMQTPGITVRPIRSIDGEHHLNEVFFDDVMVPVANRIGSEGEGWSITKFLLDNERIFAAELGTLMYYSRQLHAVAAALPSSMQQAATARIERLDSELAALEMLTCRLVAMIEDGDKRTPAFGSILKLRGTELAQAMTELLVEMFGEAAVIATDPEPGPFQRAASHARDMFFRRSGTIYGGTSEIQRTIIAKTYFE